MSWEVWNNYYMQLIVRSSDEWDDYRLRGFLDRTGLLYVEYWTTSFLNMNFLRMKQCAVSSYLTLTFYLKKKKHDPYLETTKKMIKTIKFFSTAVMGLTESSVNPETSCQFQNYFYCNHFLYSLSLKGHLHVQSNWFERSKKQRVYCIFFNLYTHSQF